MLMEGCKSAAAPDGKRLAVSAEPPAQAAAPSPDASGASTAAALGSAQARALPRLKPISSKPYPDGPSDEVLCAAIHSKETDIWERFGHFIPLYQDGVIWVGEGNDNDRKATEAAVATYAPRMFLAEGRACSKGGLLFYIDDLAGPTFDSVGNAYTLAELEAAARKTNSIVDKTMAERNIVAGQAGSEIFRRICHQDPEQCDLLLRLRAGSSLCGGVISAAEAFFARSDRSWAKDPSVKFDGRRLSAACQALPAVDKVCVFTKDETERTECWRKLAPKMGL